MLVVVIALRLVVVRRFHNERPALLSLFVHVDLSALSEGFTITTNSVSRITCCDGILSGIYTSIIFHAKGHDSRIASIVSIASGYDSTSER